MKYYIKYFIIRSGIAFMFSSCTYKPIVKPNSFSNLRKGYKVRVHLANGTHIKKIIIKKVIGDSIVIGKVQGVSTQIAISEIGRMDLKSNDAVKLILVNRKK